jgi:hypothetical protein
MIENSPNMPYPIDDLVTEIKNSQNLPDPPCLGEALRRVTLTNTKIL